VKTHQERVFRIPIEELRSMLESQYGVNLTEVEPYLEKECIVFAIGIDESQSVSHIGDKGTQRSPPSKARSRRSRRRRNRVKTRGWNVVAKITNTKGLIANVYEPFVMALKDSQVARAEQKRLVRQIIAMNGNSPTDESVEYFLSNTLEYLDQLAKGRGESNG